MHKNVIITIMKKFFSFFACVIFSSVFLLTSCGDDNDEHWVENRVDLIENPTGSYAMVVVSDISNSTMKTKVLATDYDLPCPYMDDIILSFDMSDLPQRPVVVGDLLMVKINRCYHAYSIYHGTMTEDISPIETNLIDAEVEVLGVNLDNINQVISPAEEYSGTLPVHYDVVDYNRDGNTDYFALKVTGVSSSAGQLQIDDRIICPRLSNQLPDYGEWADSELNFRLKNIFVLSEDLKYHALIHNYRYSQWVATDFSIWETSAFWQTNKVAIALVDIY